MANNLGSLLDEAKQVISTLPPRLAVALPHEPPLPEWRLEAADRVAAGNVIKAFLIYERPFWRDKGFSGQSSADEGAVRVTFDTTSDEANRGHLMGFFEGADAVAAHGCFSCSVAEGADGVDGACAPSTTVTSRSGCQWRCKALRTSATVRACRRCVQWSK